MKGVAAMLNRCPGADNLRTNITITEKTCPECGREIELFSIDAAVTCECGFVAYNDEQRCIDWCRYAKECVGEEIYEKMRKR